MALRGRNSDVTERQQLTPYVWTGRASQEAFGNGEVGLALMYPASVWRLMLRAMMDIRAHPISLADRP
jgi:hypothetical protein